MICTLDYLFLCRGLATAIIYSRWRTRRSAMSMFCASIGKVVEMFRALGLLDGEDGLCSVVCSRRWGKRSSRMSRSQSHKKENRP